MNWFRAPEIKVEMADFKELERKVLDAVARVSEIEGARAKESEIHCSFCDKSQHDIKKIIDSGRGRPRIYICDECVLLCLSVITEGDLN